MESPATELSIEVLILLVAIAAMVAMGAKRFRVPYTIALVLVGLVLSFFHALPAVHLTEDLLLFTLLPALLFDAAWNVNVAYLRQYWLVIGVLAIAGLLLSVGVIGGLLSWGLGIPLLVALLFGAMISATDPVSVLALFKQMHLDHRLSTLVEGESLFNDGTAVVIFKLLLSLALMGAVSGESLPHLLSGGALQFLLVVLGGALIGAGFGFFFSYLTSRYNDHLLELTFTTIVAYGAFLSADQIAVPGAAHDMHLSGVIATVVAGLIMGTVGRGKGMSATTRVVISSFWEYAAFFVNSIIFLLIGLEIQIGFLLAQWQPILLAIVAVLLGRAVAVYALASLMNLRMAVKIPLAWQHVMVWGGLRGALSMALALSLPRDLPERPLLVAMVFGVVLFSLIGQGLSMSPLLKKLGLVSQPAEALEAYQRLKARLLMGRQALEQLEKMSQRGAVLPWVAEKVRSDLTREVSEAETGLKTLNLSYQEIEAEELLDTRSHLLAVRRAVLREMVIEGIVPERIGEELRLELDEAFLDLQGGQAPPPAEPTVPATPG